MRANKNMDHRDRTGRGTANALASPPVYTAGQRKTRRMGLRILAGIITPPPAGASHRPRTSPIQRVTHRHIPGGFGGVFPPGGRLTPAHAPPRPSGFPLSDRNPTLTPGVHWLRPVRGRFPPGPALTRPTRELRHQTQSPVHPRYSTGGAGRQETCRGYQGW